MSTTTRRTSIIASTVVLVLVASLLVWFAASAQGEVVRHTDLSDGGVWVTNSHRSWFGRLNKPAGQLDAGIYGNVARDSGIDVLQDGAAVVGIDRARNSLLPIDASRAQLGSSTGTPLPSTPEPKDDTVFHPSRVDLHGGTIAVVDPEDGKIWAQRVDTSTGVDSLDRLTPTTKPLAKVGGNAAIAVGTDGIVHAVSGDTGRIVTLTPDDSAPDGFAAPVKSKIDLSTKSPDITAVGSRYVVFDPMTSTLHVQGRPSPIHVSGLSRVEGAPAYAALQQPGPSADSVVIQGPTSAQQVQIDEESDAPVAGPITVPPSAGGGDHLLVSRPVRLDDCVHAAWAAEGRDYYGRNCGESGAQQAFTLKELGEGTRVDGVRLRVNRGLIVLNDLDTGNVFDIDDHPLKIDDWTSVIPPPKIKDDNDKHDKNLIDDRANQRPPKANPDQLKARAGTISTLHVLDNDTDSRGAVLAIDPDDVTQPAVGDVRTAVSGDGQSIELDVPEDPSSRTIHFRYTINNGTAKKSPDSTADVTVTIVGEDVNTAPRLRHGHAKLAKTTYPAVPGQAMSLGLAADWRDAENDPVTLEAVDDGTSVDGSGRLSVTAPDKRGTSRVRYRVSDGHGLSTDAEVAIKVLGDDARLAPPRAQADVIRAVVGKPIQLEPLANDVPGADPADPDARMQLAAPIRPTGGVQVETVLDSGVVTVTGTRPGHYFLTYAAQVGGGTSIGKIRVDILPPPDKSVPPIAVPDNAVVRDQLPSLTDVLANDYSPRSDVLVTQQVTSEDDWIRASIVKGRWVRVESTQPFTGNRPRHGKVHYTVSDGTKSARGEIAVTQKPQPPGAVRPVVKDDEVVVRRGDSVTIPVLDNDSMAGGIPLHLDPRSVKVISGGGTAFASGELVRYVPPPSGSKHVESAVLEYAAYPDGLLPRAVSGRIEVQVTPPPSRTHPDRAPVARSFSASVTAGEAVTVTVPTTGVDPDGDTVTLTGLTTGDGDELDLKYGRVTNVGAATLRYESYPLSQGTEVIHYKVRDRYGKTSTALIRIGVVPPGDPQPPVAVQDEVVAQPGRKVNADILANDLISTGDVVSFESWKKLNDAATRSKFKPRKDNTVDAQVPKEGHPLAVTYGITDGLFDPSRATLLVRGQKGFVNPPVARDDVAKFAAGKTRTTVDVLENDYDIDGRHSSLEVVKVLDKGARMVGGKHGELRVQARDHPYTVPYVIEDADGAKAIALVYVPTGDDGTPFAIPGKTIRMDPDSTKTIDLRDYVKAPGGGDLHITSPDTLSTSPGGDLTAKAPGASRISLTSRHHYTGPGALMLEVAATVPSKGAGGGQDAKRPKQRTAYVSIPVQVGPLTPVLRCPKSFELTVVADGPAREVDIPRLCHAWVPPGMSMDDVDFTATWKKAPEHVSLKQEGPGGRVAVIQAAEDAPGAQATLTVSAKGAAQDFDISVIVRGLKPPPPPKKEEKEEKKKDPVQKEPEKFTAPPPTVRPITVAGLNAGDSRVVSVRPYLDSPLKKPVCRIVNVGKKPGSGVSATAHGCDLTVHAKGTARGTTRLLLTVSDGPKRFAPAQVTVTVRGRPDRPTGVRAVADRRQGSSARVWWTPPKTDGGLSIQHYTVRWKGGRKNCTASPCTIDGLQNGQPYSFTVTATNAVGTSPASDPSKPVTPDKRPEAVTGVHGVGRGDHFVKVAWPRPKNEGSDITAYRVRWTNLGAHPSTHSKTVTGRTLRLTGLVNDDQYAVQVQARNGAGWGDYGPTTKVQSAGTPPQVPAPSLSPRTPTPDYDTGQVTITWQAVRPNGPDLVKYTVYRKAGGGAWQSIGTTSPDTRRMVDTMPYNGVQYSYAVTATNGANKTSERGPSSSYVANGIPETPSAPSVSTPSANYRATARITLHDSRASGFTTLQWRTTDGSHSGTWSCGSGCPEGGTVTHTISGLSVNQSWRIQARVQNAAGQWSSWSGASNSFRPYGPTKKPIGGRTTVSGAKDRTLTYHWSPDSNGRPITKYHIAGVGDTTRTSYSKQYKNDTYPGQSHSIRVRQYSSAGWGPYITLSGKTSPPKPNPPAPTMNLRRGAKSNACANCYIIDWTTTAKDGSYSMKCYRRGNPSAFYTGAVKVAGGRRSGGWCSLDPNLSSQARIVLSGGPSGTVDSGWQNWFR